MFRRVVVLALCIFLLAAVSTKDAKNSKECSKNEVWSWCGRRCEPTCKVPIPTEETCPELTCSPLKAACRCKEGYVRNEQKACIQLTKCKK
ncbi:chymotrypsin inhibitor-like [Nomia melanderi]|uniref:chymotrypsin inhibitor-like n=1 Tax=Nomia melanderi TaxID=2448451 RepID=UPI00130466BD|nr:chymotrypsin inhibitor-like [Nomia melanderi]